jgi:uncharacterized protein YpmB
MNSKLKIGIGVLLIAIIAGIAVWKYVHKSADDFSSQKPEAHFSFSQLMEKANSDTASLAQLKDKLVSIDGMIKNIKKEEPSLTVELGDTSTMSSVICQIDARHRSELETKKEGEKISLKGKLTGFAIDTEMGLGNTIEMNFCSLNQQ